MSPSSSPPPALPTIRGRARDAWFRWLGAGSTALLLGLGLLSLALLLWRALTEPTPAWSLPELFMASLRIALPSVALASPLALGVALFAVAYCPPRGRRFARETVFVLAACPPLVWAFGAQMIVLPLLERLGARLSAEKQAMVVLCLVVGAPLAKSFVDDLRVLPRSLSLAGQALGGETFSVVHKVLLPAIVPNALRALAAALVRALGEGVGLYLVLGALAEEHSLAAHLALALIDFDEANASAGFAAAALFLMVFSLGALGIVQALTAPWIYVQPEGEREELR